jgi:molybdate transport system substrate-binding protein
MLERDSVAHTSQQHAAPVRRRSRRARIGLSAGACAAAVSLVAACGSSGPSTSSGSGQVKGTVVVFAAASLTNAFNKIGTQFQKAHPGVSVKFNYAGSSSLATSIKQGAPADVFASADTTNMKTVTSANLATGQPTTFAKNKLEIMVDKGNPMKIKNIDQLANPKVKVAVCAPSVPCGKYSTEIFDKANITVKPVTEETSVTGVVTKITLGEADAGIVYVTDVKAAGNQATGVPIPPKQNVTADYPIVELKNAPNSTASKSFMQYVNSPAGQDVLRSYGFLPPSS